MLSAILRHFHIICGKRKVKLTANKCPKCLCYTGRWISQQMASLTINRLTFTFPFIATGINISGPIKVTRSTGNGIQSTRGYISFVLCIFTQAVHVCITSDLSAKCFLASFDRFTSRRHLPSRIHSDNGTIFTCVEREIAELLVECSPHFAKIRELLLLLKTSLPPWGRTLSDVSII